MEEKRDEGFNDRKMGKEYQENEDGLFDEEEIKGGDQFMAIKPWEGTVRNSVPSNYQPL